MTSDSVGRFEIIASSGNGISDAEMIFQAEVTDVLSVDRLIELSRPALGMQINPLGAAGQQEQESALHWQFHSRCVDENAADCCAAVALL